MCKVDIAEGSGLCAGGEIPEEAAERVTLVGGGGDGRYGERGGAREDVCGKHALQAREMVILRLLLLRRLVLKKMCHNGWCIAKRGATHLQEVLMMTGLGQIARRTRREGDAPRSWRWYQSTWRRRRD